MLEKYFLCNAKNFFNNRNNIQTLVMIKKSYCTLHSSLRRCHSLIRTDKRKILPEIWIGPRSHETGNLHNPSIRRHSNIHLPTIINETNETNNETSEESPSQSTTTRRRKHTSFNTLMEVKNRGQRCDEKSPF